MVVSGRGSTGGFQNDVPHRTQQAFVRRILYVSLPASEEEVFEAHRETSQSLLNIAQPVRTWTRTKAA